MLPFMFLLAVIYAAAVFAVVRLVLLRLVFQEHRELARERQIYQELIEKKGNLYYEKKKLEEQANEVFILYELSREVAKSATEEEAFDVFRKKLQANVMCDDCLFLPSWSKDIDNMKLREDYFLFPLKGKRKLLGNLAIKGIGLDDKEKVMILAHQFALTLQRIVLYQELEKVAITDSLTEVYTRRYIMDNLEVEMTRAQEKNLPLSFLMIDVDYFKRFNDRYGHLTGDRILRGIAKVIQKSVREIDIIGRYGGEEFCVILPETDAAGAQFVAERIRSNVENVPIKAFDKEVHATTSIGIVSYPKDAGKVAGLIDKADLALYRAKKMGRNIICCFSGYD